MVHITIYGIIDCSSGDASEPLPWGFSLSVNCGSPLILSVRLQMAVAWSFRYRESHDDSIELRSSDSKRLKCYPEPDITWGPCILPATP